MARPLMADHASQIMYRTRLDALSQMISASRITLQSAIARVPGSPFRLMTMPTAGNYLRIINPATVSMALERSVQPICDHKQSVGMLQNHLMHNVFPTCDNGQSLSSTTPGPPVKKYRQWSVEDALGLWSSDFNFPDLANPAEEVSIFYRVTNNLVHCPVIDNDSVKLKILLALSPHGYVVKQGNCCLECAETSIRFMTSTTSSTSTAFATSTTSRRIICVTDTIFTSVDETRCRIEDAKSRNTTPCY